jgi:phosphoenolpyruvate-protein kinase (PTS system EI component)
VEYIEMANIFGFAYFPGRVSGELRRATKPTGEGQIALVTHSDLAFVEEGWAGVIVSEGAPFSHAMIRILAFGVPTLVIRAADAEQLQDGAQAYLDADNALITLSADGVIPVQPSQAPEVPVVGKPLITIDGVAISLRASVRNLEATRLAKQYGAESIGLVRSEFLLPADGRPPDAEFYRMAIREIAEAAAPLSVTVRLLDLSSDKQPEWVTREGVKSSLLGMQGARLFHVASVSSAVHAQLEAIDQLSGQFDLRILIPYLTRREELRNSVDEIRGHMTNRVSIGAMAETPAGALEMADWFDLVDFVSIGCNDLMQCLFAADRDQPELRNYLDPYAPLLYRFFSQLAESARHDLHKVQLCGVLPQLHGVLPVLLGLGFRAFSVEPRLIPHLARSVHKLSVRESTLLANEICHARESHEMKRLLGLPSGMSQIF